MPYEVIDVTDWLVTQDETLGTKRKMWLQNKEDKQDLPAQWLFKYPREGSGEHWAEKVVAEVAALLGVAHARVELATLNGKHGSIALDFTDRKRRGPLVTGNVVLGRVQAGYEAQNPRPRQHSVELVLMLLDLLRIRAPRENAPLVAMLPAGVAFVGYLMLDALVGNTDRHHENWGILIKHGLELSPSFDHASSLGRELRDEERLERLGGRISNRTVERYCLAGRSPFFPGIRDEHSRALTVHQVFARAKEIRPQVAATWLQRLAALDVGALRSAVQELPEAVIGPIARRFAIAVLESNRRILLEGRQVRP